MKEKVVLYLGGGGMAGVFGAGIVTGLQDANFYERIKQIEGSSAGAWNAAYFSARQSRLGSTIYWEDLPKRFIRPGRLFTDGRVMDVPYLMDVLRSTKVLDLNAIRKSKIPLLARVLNTSKMVPETLDVRENPEYALESCVWAPPYAGNNHRVHVDVDIFDPIGLEELLSKHPNDKIAIVLNHRVDRPFRYWANNILHGAIGSLVNESLPLYELYREKIKRFRQDSQRALREERVLLVTPPKESDSRNTTQNPDTLIGTWLMGRKASKRILDFAA